MTLVTLFFAVVGSAASMMLAAGSSEVVVHAQNVIGNMSRANTTEPSINSDGSSLLNNLIIEHAGGGFTSLQTDADNKTWIATGSWDLVSDPSNATQSNSSAVQFNATVDMRRTDNLEGHEHQISEFNLANSSIGSTNEGSCV
jgi:hypothetical protein